MLHSYLINVLEVACIALQCVLVVRYSFQGSLLKYPILLIYCVASSATALAEYFVQNFGSHEKFIKLYYADEVGVDLLLFLMVITLTYRAMDGNPMRKSAGRGLGLITLVVAVLPFVLFRALLHDFAGFLNGASEVLNFGAAIMSLVLWTALLGARRRDGQLIMVCVGLGLQVTAQAIGFGVRNLLAYRHKWIPDVFMAVAALVSIYIWWIAFRPTARKRIITETVVTADPAAHTGSPV